MISYIDGKITLMTPTYVLLETSGIGYHVNISLNTYSQLEGKERVKLLTVLLIKEDSHTLYGFFIYYYLHPVMDNKLVVQRGRFAKWNQKTWRTFIRRIRGS